MAEVADLAGIPLFAQLEESELLELASLFEARKVSKGVKLTTEGAAGYSFFVLAAGDAAVTLGDSTVATFGPGDFFGEMAILGDGRRTATVTTTSEATVLVLFGTEFRLLQQSHPAVAAHLEEAMRRREDELQLR